MGHGLTPNSRSSLRFLVPALQVCTTTLGRVVSHCFSRSGVVCRVKYCNSLPDIPFDPKFITYPFDQNR
jgi:hypothetical protein